MRKHGHTTSAGFRSPEYLSWDAMVMRCTNPRHKSWERYGGRGISVCDRWRDFQSFLADMGPRPSGTSLDRINNDGNYEPGNCRWVDAKTQGRNRRNNRLVTIDGATKTMAEWVVEIGISDSALSHRLRAWGPTARVLTPAMPPHLRRTRASIAAAALR